MGKGFDLSLQNALKHHKGAKKYQLHLRIKELLLMSAGWVQIWKRLALLGTFFLSFWRRIFRGKTVKKSQILDLEHCSRSFRNMIPTKMLVYRGPDGGTHTDTVPNTTNATRRKKSTGELFQNGYRVRMGHGQVHDKEDQDSFCFSLGGCFHLISYWGKTYRTTKPRGISLML